MKKLFIILLVSFCILPSFCSPAQSSKKDSSKNACMANLRQLESAVEQWAMDNSKTDGEICFMFFLVPTYIKKTPECPSGGKYSNYKDGKDLFVVGGIPVCSVHGAQYTKKELEDNYQMLTVGNKAKKIIEQLDPSYVNWAREEALEELGKLGKDAVPYLWRAFKEKAVEIKKEEKHDESGETQYDENGGVQYIDKYELKDGWLFNNLISLLLNYGVGSVDDVSFLSKCSSAFGDTLDDKGVAVGGLRLKLIKTNSVQLYPEIQDVLKSSGDESRLKAVSLARNLNDKYFIPDFIKLIQKDSNEEIRVESIEALGDLGSLAKEAVPTLTNVLENEEESFKIKAGAAYSLSQLKSSFAVPALIKALKIQNEEVKMNAVFALGEIGDKSAVTALEEVLNDESADVRLYASIALSHFTNKINVSLLLDALNSDNNSHKIDAIESLGRIKDKTVVDTLTYIANNDPDTDVINAAKEAISQIKSK